MAEFKPRFGAPFKSNTYYYTNNPFYQSGYGMPNCTAYAWGRFWECGGVYPALALGNAENWYNFNDGYPRGSTPKLGAVICWYRTGGRSGHVEIVEQINDDGTIITSGSAWKGFNFRLKTRNPTYNWDGGDYIFQGFIYNPTTFDSVGDPIYDTGTDDDHGGWITGNRYLNKSEMQNNVNLLWNYFQSKGWTKNAVAGMLGNMQTESSINPGIWEGLIDDPEAYYEQHGRYPGYGLVQWTPYQKYSQWWGEGWENNGIAECERIQYEMEHNIQWGHPTMTFEQFSHSRHDPRYLATLFEKYYEVHAGALQPIRRKQAVEWFKYLKGTYIPLSEYNNKRRSKPYV